MAKRNKSICESRQYKLFKPKPKTITWKTSIFQEMVIGKIWNKSNNKYKVI